MWAIRGMAAERRGGGGAVTACARPYSVSGHPAGNAVVYVCVLDGHRTRTIGVIAYLPSTPSHHTDKTRPRPRYYSNIPDEFFAIFFFFFR